MVNRDENAARAFLRLKTIMDELRVKCPWDRKQTIESLRGQTIEELYELTGAITEGDWNGIREELGDLMLHLLFYARLAEEQDQFDIAEALDEVCEKLIRRHPHVYGSVSVKDEEDVKRNWEQLKIREGKESVLQGVPAALPALMKAVRLQGKARQVGFDWEEAGQVWEKVREEIDELQEAVHCGSQDQVEEEFGDLLFSLVNYARFLRVDPENALEKSNRKFTQRFRAMEARIREQRKSFSEMTLADWDELWNEVKGSQNKGR